MLLRTLQEDPDWLIKNKAHVVPLWPQAGIFTLAHDRRVFSPFFPRRRGVSELYPLQQYPIVNRQDKHRKGF